ncbi:MAG: DUF2786 domain-containing protein, partial [Pseudonocardiaceae bacterium]
PGAPAAPTPPDSEEIAMLLFGAVHAHLTGDSSAVRATAAMLAGERPGAVDTVVQTALSRMVREAWTGGWLPYDLHQTALRQLDAVAAGYVVDAIAAEAQQYAAATVHQRWADQLRQIDATVWWQPGASHLAQWAEHQRLGRTEALVTVIEVLVMLSSLPVLPRILPLPGSAPVGAPRPSRRGVDQKVLSRVRALLSKAESTGFPEEAEALSAKAQELMSRYALEHAVLDAEQGTDPEPATARRLWLDNPYVGAKALLVNAVASANRCRTMLYEKIGFITVLGDEVDLEIVEVLTTSLLVQATKAMLAGGSRVSRTGQSRTRSYRQSFLVSYATRIGERLSTATEEAMTGGCGDPAVDTDRLLPVLAARERVVDDLFETMFPHTVQRSVSVSNAEGWYAGRAAADLAVLDTHRPLDARTG